MEILFYISPYSQIIFLIMCTGRILSGLCSDGHIFDRVVYFFV